MGSHSHRSLLLPLPIIGGQWKASAAIIVYHYGVKLNFFFFFPTRKCVTVPTYKRTMFCKMRVHTFLINCIKWANADNQCIDYASKNPAHRVALNRLQCAYIHCHQYISYAQCNLHDVHKLVTSKLKATMNDVITVKFLPEVALPSYKLNRPIQHLGSL